ncbi:hypothetical protein HU200_022974 [Digitaria exilis]|uniref:Uncharacterized protein n=1 Tax=Digitaria exilis TaxID=1010633 RepID=A0A835C6T6_9POAL|nr:hypothetical protein HU200_022974 [Digitaria exilis]
MEEDCCFSNWGLDAVVRLGCRRRLSPPRREDNNNNPFAAFLPPPQKPAPAPVPELAKEPEADASWRFPDFFAGGGQDAGDELLRALLASSHPPMSSQPTPPPLPPSPQQQQPVAAAAVDVAPPQPRAAPARAQPSGRQVPGGVPRSKRRYACVPCLFASPHGNGSSSLFLWFY